MSMVRGGHAECELQVLGEIDRRAQGGAVRLDRRTLAAHVKAEAAEADSRGKYVFDQQFRVGRFGAEFARQIRFDVCVAERQPHQDPDAGGQPGELLGLGGIVDDERADTGTVGVLDVGDLLDGMGVDAPVHRDSQRPDEVHFGVGGDVEPDAGRGHRVEDGRMGRSLYRVMRLHSGEVSHEQPALADHLRRIENQQRCAVLGDQPLPILPRGLGAGLLKQPRPHRRFHRLPPSGYFA